jgi:clan AA aspartic protease
VIIGSVNAFREVVISVSVRDASGRVQKFDAVVDTGFNGSLTLPAAVIATLGLVWRNRGSVILANGSVEECDVYAGVVIWDGQPRNVLVECAETDPLVGMALIYGYDLNIQAVDGGLVTLTLI